MPTFSYSSVPLLPEPPVPRRVSRLLLGGGRGCLKQWALQVRKRHGQDLAVDSRNGQGYGVTGRWAEAGSHTVWGGQGGTQRKEDGSL